MKTVMMESGMMGMATVPNHAMMMGAQVGAMNMMMIHRCTFKMETMKNGMKMKCMAGDETAAAVMQNLCQTLVGGMMTWTMMMNGMMIMSCNMTMGICKCEMTADGICITCTSGDAAMCKMIQESANCMLTMMQSGCTCCVSMNNTPVCCGYAV